LLNKVSSDTAFWFWGMAARANRRLFYECVSPTVGRGVADKSQHCSDIYCDNTYDPTIVDDYRTDTMIDEQSCSLDVRDVAGVEVYSDLYTAYLRDYECFFLVYSICSRASFCHLAKLHDLLSKNTHDGNVSVVIVGTQSDRDKDRQVSTEQGNEFAESRNCGFVETSAKNNTNVKEAFCKVVRERRCLESK
jgi:GTPase KRas protein